MSTTITAAEIDAQCARFHAAEAIALAADAAANHALNVAAEIAAAAELAAAAAPSWTGSYVTNCQSVVGVRYHGPTNTLGSRWGAFYRRDSETVWRAYVSFADGPIAAAQKLIDDREINLSVVSVGQIEPDAYAILCAAS